MVIVPANFRSLSRVAALLAVVLAGMLGVGAAPAAASKLSESYLPGYAVEGGAPVPGTHYYTLTDDQDVANTVTASLDAPAQVYTITDTAGISLYDGVVRPNDLCTAVDATTVRCRIDNSRANITVGRAVLAVSLNGGDDTYVGTGGGLTQVFGRSGDDRITTGDGADELTGDEGDDVIESGAGDDLVRDGAGSDTVTTGAGKDMLEMGGTGALAGIDRLESGDGDDVFAPVDHPTGRVDVLAGAGNDAVNAGFTRGTLDLGPGNDDAELVADPIGYRGEMVSTLVCGAGMDRVTPGPGDVVKRDCDRLAHPDARCSRKTPCRAGLALRAVDVARFGATAMVQRTVLVMGASRNVLLPMTGARFVSTMAKAATIKVQLVIDGAGLYRHRNPTFTLVR